MCDVTKNCVCYWSTQADVHTTYNRVIPSVLINSYYVLYIGLCCIYTVDKFTCSLQETTSWEAPCTKWLIYYECMNIAFVTRELKLDLQVHRASIRVFWSILHTTQISIMSKNVEVSWISVRPVENNFLHLASTPIKPWRQTLRDHVRLKELLWLY